MTTSKRKGGADDGWEEFTERFKPVAAEPTLTIMRSGMIGLNDAAFDALGRPAWVVLRFHREKRLLAIRPTTEDVPHKYKLNTNDRDKNVMFSAKSFCGNYGIELDESRRRTAKLVGSGLVVDLSEPGTVVSRRTGDISAPG
jgi:hypothetical protein